MKFNDDFVRKKLCNHYSKGVIDRDLIKTKVYDGNRNWVIFFMIAGSPPKGYAIFENHFENRGVLWLYDAWGRRFKIYNDMTYEDVQK